MASRRVLFNEFITSGAHFFQTFAFPIVSNFFNDFCFVSEEVSSNWRLKSTGFDAVYRRRPGAAIIWVIFFLPLLFFEISKLIDFFLFCRAEFDSQGGRRCHHLCGLVNYAVNFSHFVVIVGDNDVNTEKIEFILNRFNELSDAVWQSKVKFCRHMRRKDLNSDLVASNNTFLSEQLGLNHRKLIKKGLQ